MGVGVADLVLKFRCQRCCCRPAFKHKYGLGSFFRSSMWYTTGGASSQHKSLKTCRHASLGTELFIALTGESLAGGSTVRRAFGRAWMSTYCCSRFNIQSLLASDHRGERCTQPYFLLEQSMVARFLYIGCRRHLAFLPSRHVPSLSPVLFFSRHSRTVTRPSCRVVSRSSIARRCEDTGQPRWFSGSKES